MVKMATIYRHWFPCTVTLEHPHGKGYTGQTYRTVEERDKQRFAPSAVKDSVLLKDAIVKYGQENMQTDIIEDNLLPIPDLVDEREKYWIAYFDDFHNGYNRTKGGEGFDSEAARENARKRLADGTHHFLDGKISRETQRKRIEDGTHHLLSGEIQRETQHKRLKDGTHNFLDSEFREFQREIARESNRKRVADGTHHLLSGEIQRESNRKRLKDGTHNLLAKNRSPETEKRRKKGAIESNRKRIEDGTHHLLGGEIQREAHRKHVADGTHHLLAKNRCPETEKKRIEALRNTLARKRHKAYWYYIIALSRYWYETHAYSIQYRGDW